MRPKLAAVAIVVACAAEPARAEPADCQAEAAALRARLVADARHARIWDLSWTLAFGAATAGQLWLAHAQVNPIGTFDQNFKESLYVGAAKSGLGVLAHLVSPLRIEVPPPVGDACADLDTLRRALAKAGRRERTTFWLNHLGSLATNLAGAIVLAERRSWQTGVTSAALGYPVGLLSVYTAPRASWHQWRDLEPSWTVSVSATGGGAALWLSGEL